MTSTRHRLIVRACSAATALALAVTGLVALSVGSASAASAGTGTGYLSTKGSQIVDSTGATVRLTGISWFGMETDNHTFHGLWAGRDATWKMQMDHMAALGYNTIRVPFTGDSLKAGAPLRVGVIGASQRSAR